MKKIDVLIQLQRINEAHRKWNVARLEFLTASNHMMARLLHEAAANFMSAEEVAKASGFTVKNIRNQMRNAGLNPKDGKRLLSKKAAEALANNAALLGIEPHEMDLMSPLAYLPMGEQMKRELRASAVSQVTDVPCLDDSGHGPFTSGGICHACGQKSEVSGNTYEKSKPRLEASIRMGIAAEEDWPGPSVKPGDLTEEQIDWLASWLAGEGFVKG